MEDVRYGANGVRLNELDDYQTQRETARNDATACVPLLLGLSGSFALLWYLRTCLPDVSFRTILELSALVIGLTSVGAALAFFRLIAQEDHLLPGRGSEAQPAEHITGLGAALALGLLAFIGGAALLGQLLYPNFSIPEVFGLGVMVVLGGGFLFLTLMPHVGALIGSGDLMSRLRFVTAWLLPVGRLLSVLDSWLVHLIAPAVGTMFGSWLARYACFAANIFIGCIFAWYCPAPFGIIGAIWAILVVVSVARRWAWTEGERQRLHVSPDLPRSRLRVSIDQDLRDEAICGLLLLMVVLPITMRQFYLSAMEPDAFQFDGNVQDDPIAWMGFFGIELVKALPFIDWADIYGAQGAARIHVNSSVAMHSVFTARVLIDVLFLSALLQAVSISVGLARHKREFLRGAVSALDERIEQSEFLRLVYRHKGGWAFRPEIQDFKHYDQRRLRRLKLIARTKPRLAAVVGKVCELANLQFDPPAEQLMGEASARRPKRAALEAALSLVESDRDYDLEHLAAARRFLNWKRSIEDIRQRVAQLLISNVPPSRERDSILMEMLCGQEADSLLAIRIMVIDPLGRNARQNPEVISILQSVATDDRATAVKKRAKAVLSKLGVADGSGPSAQERRKIG